MATTVASITVKFLSFARLQDERVGGPVRTISGQLRGDVLWTKRAWKGTAYAVNAAEADTLRAAIGPSTPVNVAGDLFHGSTVSAIVEVENAEAVRLPGGFYEVLDLSIREA